MAKKLRLPSYDDGVGRLPRSSPGGATPQMWPRKQLDIGWRDLAYGLGSSIVARRRASDESVVGRGWIPSDDAVVSLSVRTGWDVLLASLRFPPGSEILMSAVTIPDMARIVEHHGLVPVPIDVDADRLEPALDQLERAISPRSRAILVAHLFGARADMAPITRLARQHGLVVIEDCAQAFVGRGYAGHPDTDCAMFSFGPIKTATALGGAVLRVRDRNLRARMAALQRSYPVQSRGAYLKRIVKYAFFRILCKPRIYGAVARTCRSFGFDYDRAFSNAAHSFDSRDLVAQLRQQPCNALVRMLKRRLATFDRHGTVQLRRRAARGRQLAESLPRGMVVGGQNVFHTFWVVPVAVANQEAVVDSLRAAGFDATSRSSLCVVRPINGSLTEEPPCAAWLANTVFLPNGDDMPDDDWMRMASVLRDVAASPPLRPKLSLPETVSMSSRATHNGGFQ